MISNKDIKITENKNYLISKEKINKMKIENAKVNK